MGVQFDELPEWEFTTSEVGRYEFEVVARRTGGISGSERTNDPDSALVSLREWAAAVERDQAASELWLCADLHWAGMLDSRSLPLLATRALVAGLDNEFLRALAGLDLAPFDPRDASDLFARALSETQMPSRRDAEKLDRVAHVLASAWSRRRLTTPQALGHFYRLAVWLEYPDNPSVMRIYSLDDEWGAEWGRTKAEIESELAEVMASISAGQPHVPGALLDVVVGGS